VNILDVYRRVVVLFLHFSEFQNFSLESQNSSFIFYSVGARVFPKARGEARPVARIEISACGRINKIIPAHFARWGGGFRD
jgi:hypothetical protein